MKITEIISGDAPSLSFEVFPPKTSDKFESVMGAAAEIAKLKPSYMSVTYGAGGGNVRIYDRDMRSTERLRRYRSCASDLRVIEQGGASRASLKAALARDRQYSRSARGHSGGI